MRCIHTDKKNIHTGRFAAKGQLMKLKYIHVSRQSLTSTAIFVVNSSFKNILSFSFRKTYNPTFLARYRVDVLCSYRYPYW